MFGRPIRQYRHLPHVRLGSTTTRSPSSSPSTAGPFSRTVPTYSWPRMAPTVAGWPGGTSRMCTSVPQMLAASTRSSTSSSPLTVGTGTSFTASLPLPSKTAASIAFSVM